MAGDSDGVVANAGKSGVETNMAPIGGTKPHSEDHSCYAKSHEILRRTGIATNHADITWICEEMGFSDADEFYAWMNSLTDDELKSQVKAMLERKRRKQMSPQEVAMLTETYIS